MPDIRSNFSINKIKQAGLKDQLKGFQFVLKFFDFTNNINTGKVEEMNTHNGNSVIVYTKSISGLPEIAIDKVEDNYYGFKNIIPTTPNFDSNEIQVTLRITEDLNPLKPFLDRLLVLLQSQLSMTDEVVINDNNDISLNKITDSQYEALFTNDGNLIEQLTETFFFDTTVTLLEYNTRKPLFAYILRNSWISGLKIAEAVGEGTDVINATLKITFDSPEVYKVTK